MVRWVGETLAPGETLAVAGDSSGGTFVAAVAAMAQDDGWDRITHQVLYYPSLDLDFDDDRYASLRENAVGYGLETAGLKPFNAFYLESGADPADPLVSPIKRDGPVGPAAGTRRHRRARPAARRGRALRRAPARGRRRRDDQPLRRRRPRLRPALLVDPRLPPGLRRDRRVPVVGAVSVDVHPIAAPWGRFAPLQLLHRRPRAGDRRHRRDRLARPTSRRALEALGRRIEDVRWILLTHGHIDHVGGAHALWEATGRRAEVVISEADAHFLRSRRAHVEEALALRGAATSTREALRGRRVAEVARRRSPASWSRPARSATATSSTSAATVRPRPSRSPATPPAPWRTSSRAAASGARLRRRRRPVHGAASGFPGYEDPDAYRASLERTCADATRGTSTSATPTDAPTGRPSRWRSTPTGAAEALTASLEREARVRAATTASRRRRERVGVLALREQVAARSATPATRRSSPRRSSPRCTATARSDP